MGIKENIKRLRTEHDLTQLQLADAIGITRSSVTQWESGWSQPKMGNVEQLAEFFGVQKSEIIDDRSNEAFRIPSKAIIPQASPSAYAPLRGRIHAGMAQEPEILDKYIQLPANVAAAHPQAYFLEVEGDCMDRVYPEGCYILVDPGREPQNGSIAAVIIDGCDAVMRRLLCTSSTMVLSPESYSSEHKDVIITASSGHIVELIGTVVWFQSSKEME